MFVPVAGMGRMAVLVVNVVGVVAMLDRLMAAVITVGMSMRVVDDVALPGALVPVRAVHPVRVTLVAVIGVIAVLNRDVATGRAVLVSMIGVLSVIRLHRASLPYD